MTDWWIDETLPVPGDIEVRQISLTEWWRRYKEALIASYEPFGNFAKAYIHAFERTYRSFPERTYRSFPERTYRSSPRKTVKPTIASGDCNRQYGPWIEPWIEPKRLYSQDHKPRPVYFRRR